MLIVSVIVLLIIVATVAFMLQGRSRLIVIPVFVVGAFILGAVGTTVIESDQTGIVQVVFGQDMPSGQIVALNGEKGPQAEILGPGWHWVDPFTKKVTKARVITIEPGTVGVVEAFDGKPLPAGITFAPEWSDISMLNAPTFLSKGGFKGPQLTVLAPGTYRYNTALFRITAHPVLTVPQGQVAVIKDNTGRVSSKVTETINGNQLVPRGFAGIWDVALTPGTYYIHPYAFKPILVKTTQRVYTYQKGDKFDDSISIRSSDGFQIAADIRIVVVVTPENAPRLVALHGDPDQVVRNAQEGEDLEILESQGVLPVIRAEVRNIGEKITALNMVNQRSEKEKELETAVGKKLESGFLKVIAIYLANVDPTITEAGRNLLSTQTDKKIAQERIATYQQQQAAEETRKALVNAQTTANTEKELVEAQRSILINKERGAAQLALAEYQRKSYQEVISALGVDYVGKMELIKLAGEKNVTITPNVYFGSGGDSSAALAGAIFAKPPHNPAPSTEATR